RQPRPLRVPLIPANERADASAGGVEGPEAEIARREVELLVEERIVRDMHLPVRTEELPVGVDDHRGVVVDARGAALEQRSDDDHAGLARGLLQGLAGRSGDRLSELEVGVILALAEVPRAEQLGEADQLGAVARGGVDAREGAVDVVFGIRRAAHLHEANLELTRAGHDSPTSMSEMMLPSRRSQLGRASS